MIRISRSLAAICIIGLQTVPTGGWAEDRDEPSGDAQVVVTGTRTPTLIRDEPLRVLAVPAEEIEENLTVQPGDLSSLLNELPGVRMQPLAPGLGGAGLQLRGMPARHALVLTDGLPSLGGQPDAFGLLQTPPLDLERVEIIQGVASALYGGAPLAGVLNLVSRGADSEPSVLANVTSRGGRDLEGFLTAKGASRWSGTLTAGAHDQSRQDVSGEGWADVPGYRRVTLRPRLWWDAGQDRSLFLTTGIVDEDRTGGTLPGRILPTGFPFAEALRTRRFDAGAVSRWAFDRGNELSGRLSLASTHQDRIFGSQRISSTEDTAFGEGALSGESQGHRWVLGVAFQHDRLSAAAAPGVGYSYEVPAAFAQDDYSAAPWLKFSGSLRIDTHNVYGAFVSPRLSVLLRPFDSSWSLRASIAGGFAAPTPFVEEVDATSLGALQPLRGLHAERAVSASLDAKWSARGWDVNLSLFTSEIRNPLEVLPSAGDKLILTNALGPRRAPGAEALIGYVTGPLHVVASWSYLSVTQTGALGLREDAPLVPDHAGEIGAILESEKRGRIGLELGYTGKQALSGDPYRSVSRPYVELNALAELRLGTVAVFLNAINLTDVRQTHYDPLLRPSPGPGGDPMTDMWAPLDGRTFNLGIRAEL